MAATDRLHYVLLCTGAIKGILGLCCCPLVGAWGLDILVEHPRQIPHYYEEELHGRTVIYDCGGFPVHPDTKLRTVRTISRDEELGESIDWSNTIIIKEQKGPDGKLEYYGIGGRDYCAMENADTEFVMDELKRSRKRLMVN
ncbi:hypothetical protein C0J52_11800 [Blattella germanica]|nr:hypothetical protein C0J52_11800 [Blattella germanica]